MKPLATRMPALIEAAPPMTLGAAVAAVTPPSAPATAPRAAPMPPIVPSMVVPPEPIVPASATPPVVHVIGDGPGRFLQACGEFARGGLAVLELFEHADLEGVHSGAGEALPVEHHGPVVRPRRSRSYWCLAAASRSRMT